MYQEKTMDKKNLITSVATKEGFPTTTKPELAFAGRSNSGKSSLINSLFNSKCAKTSSKPGKTILLNFFNYKDKFVLVDLPGYGYAKVSIKLRKSWKGLIEDYFLSRNNIRAVFILSDVRRGIEEDEINLALWLNNLGLNTFFIFTKIDKLSNNELTKQKQIITKDLQKIGFDFVANVFYVSVLKKLGIEELKTKLEELGDL